MLQRPQEIRQRYLDAMGITLWVRPTVREAQTERRQCVKQPMIAETPEPAESRVQATADVEATAPVQPVIPALEQRQPEASATATPDTRASASTLPSASHAGIEFIQQWWAANGWLVVDTRPASISNTDQQHCDRLIGYLGHYLTGQARPEIAHYIDWPLFENPAIKHDLEEARVYLQQKWDSVARRMTLSGVLMLGDWSEQLLRSGLAGNAEAATLTIVRGPGATEMLGDSAAKRLLWQELQRV